MSSRFCSVYSVLALLSVLNFAKTVSAATNCNKFLRSTVPWLNKTDIYVLPRVRDIDRANFVKYYKCNIQRIEDGELPKRYVLYSPSEGTSWGNRMRGTLSAFVLALVTERILVLDHDCHQRLFHSPPGITLATPHSILSKVMAKKGSRALKDSDDIRRQVAKSKDLNKLFPEGVLKHGSILSLDTAIARNPEYERKIVGLFGSKSRFSRTGLILQYLLQAPTSTYVYPVAEYMTLIGLRKKKTRPFLVANIHPSENEQTTEQLRKDFFACVNKMINKWQYNGTIYLTTDDESIIGFARNNLNVSNIVFRNHTASPSWHFSSCVTPSTIDWYVMGESAGIISSPSTFSALSAARTGFTFRFIDAAKDCIPLRSKSTYEDVHF